MSMRGQEACASLGRDGHAQGADRRAGCNASRARRDLGVEMLCNSATRERKSDGRAGAVKGYAGCSSTLDARPRVPAAAVSFSLAA